jgi:hypothetical protein
VTCNEEKEIRIPISPPTSNPRPTTGGGGGGGGGRGIDSLELSPPTSNPLSAAQPPHRHCRQHTQRRSAAAPIRGYAPSLSLPLLIAIAAALLKVLRCSSSSPRCFRSAWFPPLLILLLALMLQVLQRREDFPRHPAAARSFARAGRLPPCRR